MWTRNNRQGERRGGARGPSFALALAAVLLLASPVRAEEETPVGQPRPLPSGSFSLVIEPGLAWALSDPQANRFELGGSQTVKALWSLNRWFGLGPTAGFLLVPAADRSEGGTAGTFGGGARFHRPHDVRDTSALRALSPWIDADLLYVRTGPLNRAGLSAAVGAAMPIGEDRVFWLGPFVRYLHVLQQPEHDGDYDNHDAKLLSVGLGLEVGTGVDRERDELPAASTEVRTVRETVVSCPDRDNDTIPDDIDHCPDVAGPMESLGCPAYKKVVVKKDKLELKEKIYFAWNAATIEPQSHETLDDVVQALKDNKNFRVMIEGHASAEGTDDHNQTLSEGRAEAVLDYLASHGIPKERLTFKGFASSVPLDTNATPEGRENNRRVEFVVHFVILPDGSKAK